MSKPNNKNWLMNLIGDKEVIKKNKTFYWIIIFFLVGLAFMIFSSFLDITDQVTPYESQAPVQETSNMLEKNTVPKTMQDYEKIYENQLTEIITEMLGVNEVVVKVNLDSTEELLVESNTSYSEQVTKEQDKQGGSRNISNVSKDEQVVIYRVDGNDEPLVIKTIKPKVRGVVIVAEGAENLQVKAMITEAVQRLLDVPPHKIAILPKRG